jgi:hypothetical protein
VKARVLTYEQWLAEGYRRFGEDRRSWRFVCPVCGHAATPADWLAVGASQGEIAFSCVGRRIEGAKEAFAQGDNGKGCTYAGGGLFKLNPVDVLLPTGERSHFFEFDGA